MSKQDSSSFSQRPYYNSMIQTDAEYYAQKVPEPGFIATAKASEASDVGKQGKEGKESIIDAQESEEFLDGRTELANTRLPYASTLL